MDCVRHPGVDAPYQCFRCREFICVDCESKVEGMSYCRSCLATIHERLNSGGVLVLTSPYTWLEEFTKRENWVGGIRKDGEPYTTTQGLQELLGAHFRMIDQPRDIEFVIRETRRKFQHTISQMTAWERVR